MLSILVLEKKLQAPSSCSLHVNVSLGKNIEIWVQDKTGTAMLVNFNYYFTLCVLIEFRDKDVCSLVIGLSHPPLFIYTFQSFGDQGMPVARLLALAMQNNVVTHLPIWWFQLHLD